MATPQTRDALLDVIRKSGLLPEQRLAELSDDTPLPADPEAAGEALVRRGLLTSFQVRHLLAGRFKGLIIDQYRVLRPLGKGGMGLVYLAEHLTINRQVAIKILRTDMLSSPGVRERFTREGRAIAALDHPNIVRLYAVGNEGDTHYLIMEYAEGRSLETVLRQQGRVPLYDAVDYAMQVADGLQHAHERGIVHRDVKPANLLLDATGTVKILDMGLARFHADSTDNLTERVGGGILGSPDYIAPEQASQQLDTRTDVYSLGATLYALLLGEPPFKARSIPEKIADHRTRLAVPPHQRDPAIPRELSQVVLKMMAKNPADRYQTPGEVVEALTPFTRPPEPVALWSPPSRPSSPAVPVSAPPARKPGRLGVLAACLLGLLGVGAAAACTWAALHLSIGW